MLGENNNNWNERKEAATPDDWTFKTDKGDDDLIARHHLAPYSKHGGGFVKQLSVKSKRKKIIRPQSKRFWCPENAAKNCSNSL